MKTLARSWNGRTTSDEVQGLRRSLERCYAQMREQAWAKWQRRHAGHDPSDACVHVRIEPSEQRTLAG